jgi:hypothetical protein
MLYFQTLRVLFCEIRLIFGKVRENDTRKTSNVAFQTLYFKPQPLDCPFLIIDKYVLFCKGLVGV